MWREATHSTGNECESSIANSSARDAGGTADPLASKAKRQTCGTKTARTRLAEPGWSPTQLSAPYQRGDRAEESQLEIRRCPPGVDPLLDRLVHPRPAIGEAIQLPRPPRPAGHGVALREPAVRVVVDDVPPRKRWQVHRARHEREKPGKPAMTEGLLQSSSERGHGRPFDPVDSVNRAGGQSRKSTSFAGPCEPAPGRGPDAIDPLPLGAATTCFRKPLLPPTARDRWRPRGSLVDHAHVETRPSVGDTTPRAPPRGTTKREEKSLPAAGRCHGPRKEAWVSSLAPITRSKTARRERSLQRVGGGVGQRAGIDTNGTRAPRDATSRRVARADTCYSGARLEPADSDRASPCRPTRSR